MSAPGKPAGKNSALELALPKNDLSHRPVHPPKTPPKIYSDSQRINSSKIIFLNKTVETILRYLNELLEVVFFFNLKPFQNTTS